MHAYTYTYTHLGAYIFHCSLFNNTKKHIVFKFMYINPILYHVSAFIETPCVFVKKVRGRPEWNSQIMGPLILQREGCQLGAAVVYRLAQWVRDEGQNMGSEMCIKYCDKISPATGLIGCFEKLSKIWHLCRVGCMQERGKMWGNGRPVGNLRWVEGWIETEVTEKGN